MSEPTAPAVAPREPVRSVDVSERVPLLDALRGFALCGVFVSNLFGLGFSIQLARAQARGSSLVPLYSRRLLVLLGIGLTHSFGLWAGDVLSTYAVVGFLLLLFRQRSDRTVLAWVLALLGGMQLLFPVLEHFGPILLHGAQAAAEPAQAYEEHTAWVRARYLAGRSSGSFWSAAQESGRFFLAFVLPRIIRVPWMIILGHFLLGLLAGRHLLLQEVERNRPLHRKLLGWGLVLGILGNGAWVVVQRLHVAGVVDPNKDTWMLGMSVIQELGYLGLAAVYVSGFALLFQHERWRRGLQVLAPVGRMALTHYLLQTVVSLWLYDGWGMGLIGQLPPSHSIALALGIFVLQVPVSHAWLACFRLGPVEWLWRSLTYGRAQRMRLVPK